jgi:HK97 family phage major capsid protein
MNKELEDKIGAIADEYREGAKVVNKRFAEMNLALARLKTPNLWAVPDPPIERTAEDKAFSEWIRRGTVDLETKVLTIGSDPSFGFSCPPQLSSEILHALTEGSPMRGLAKGYSTNRTSLEILKKSASGAVVEQSSEVGEILETTGLAYAKLTFTPKTLVYLLKQSVLHLEDTAFPMEQEIALELGEAFATYEADKHINGTEGLLANVGDGTLNTYPELHAGSTSVITAEILIDLIYGLPTRFLANAKFIMNRPTLAYVRKIKDAVSGVFLLSPLQTGKAPDLCGFPVIVNDNMPSIGSANYVIGFGDWNKAFGIVDTTPTFTVQRMLEHYAVYGIVGYLARFRTTSGPLVGEAATFLQMSA